MTWSPTEDAMASLVWNILPPRSSRDNYLKLYDDIKSLVNRYSDKQYTNRSKHSIYQRVRSFNTNNSSNAPSASSNTSKPKQQSQPNPKLETSTDNKGNKRGLKRKLSPSAKNTKKHKKKKKKHKKKSKKKDKDRKVTSSSSPTSATHVSATIPTAAPIHTLSIAIPPTSSTAIPVPLPLSTAVLPSSSTVIPTDSTRRAPSIFDPVITEPESIVPDIIDPFDTNHTIDIDPLFQISSIQSTTTHPQPQDMMPLIHTPTTQPTQDHISYVPELSPEFQPIARPWCSMDCPRGDVSYIHPHDVSYTKLKYPHDVSYIHLSKICKVVSYCLIVSILIRVALIGVGGTQINLQLIREIGERCGDDTNSNANANIIGLDIGSVIADDVRFNGGVGFDCIAERVNGVEYSVDHERDEFVVLMIDVVYDFDYDVTPSAAYDYGVRNKTLETLKVRSMDEYDATDYQTKHICASTPIPMSLIARSNIDLSGDGQAVTTPLYLIGYGSYGSSSDSYFSVARLVDHGVIVMFDAIVDEQMKATDNSKYKVVLIYNDAFEKVLDRNEYNLYVTSIQHNDVFNSNEYHLQRLDPTMESIAPQGDCDQYVVTIALHSGKYYYKVHIALSDGDADYSGFYIVWAEQGFISTDAETYGIGFECRNDTIVINDSVYCLDNAPNQATKHVDTVAGLHVVRIINEPTRAIAFDLGGDTFDLSLQTLHEGVLEVQATSGDAYLGVKQFVQKHGINLSQNDKAMGKLSKLCEKTKQTKIEIDRIGLIGGSTRIPQIQAMVNQLFVKDLNHGINLSGVAFDVSIHAAADGDQCKDILVI
eukprot:317250_1